MNSEDDFKNLSICCMMFCSIENLKAYSQTHQIVFGMAFLFLIISAIFKALKG